MSTPDEPRRPLGVRPAGDRWARIHWTDPGDLSLEVGDQVVVWDGSGEWPAEVVVASGRIVEAPPFDTLPLVTGPADPATWPAPPTGAGLDLLRSLDLPDATPGGR